MLRLFLGRQVETLEFAVHIDRVGVCHSRHKIGDLQQANVRVGIRLAIVAKELCW